MRFRFWELIGSKKMESGRKQIKSYDSEKLEPVIRRSICTGEKTAGFMDLKTGKFFEDTIVRNEAELKTFLAEYGISSDKKMREVY